MSRRFLTVSARDIDPLSWFTGPFVPLVFGSINLLYGLILAAVTWSASAAPVLQYVGVLLCTAACVFVHIRARPRFPTIGWLVGAITLTVAGAGFVLSAVGYAHGAFAVELWWAPFGFALAIGSLGPYLAPRRILVLGSASTVIFVTLAFVQIGPMIDPWGPVSTYVIVLTPVLSGLVATATFSYIVVSRMLPLIEKRSEVVVAERTDRLVEARERVRLAQFTARAVPFLEQVADAGVISPEDRNLAGQLARRLRDDLVTQSNLSWLESIASDSRLVVLDPERRANRMRSNQRTALRALLRAILDTPGTDAGSLLVELRGRPDGATAVGVSLEMELPEGRRILHLAPYYLALRTTVDDLSWTEDRFLRVTFNLPPGAAEG